MVGFHTFLNDKCPDLISQIKNIKTLGLYFRKDYNDVSIEDLQSRVAKALVQNQHIDSLQLMSNYDRSGRLADELIASERPILTDLHLLKTSSVLSLF